MAVNSKINDDLVAGTNRLHLYVGFLKEIRECAPLKATVKGNLPAKFVQELYSQGYDYLHPYPCPRPVRKEDDAWFIRDLHELARIQGLVMLRKGRITLTKKGLGVLERPLGELYLSLLSDYFFRFYLGLRKGYALLPPYLFGILLQLILRHGDKEREMGFYVQRLLRIAPALLDEYTPDARGESLLESALFSGVMVRYLEEFGLVSTREERTAGNWLNEKRLVRKTGLFDQVFLTF